LVAMDLKLHIIKREDLEDYSLRHRFCFSVIDVSKSKSYPSNYVCMLPAQIRKNKNENIFQKLFGDKSIEQAKILLTDALKTVDDSEVRVELERRLKLLEPEMTIKIKCSNCGKMFLPRRIRRFKNNFCEECMKKKFGSRE
jgi:hypothetical protein